MEEQFKQKSKSTDKKFTKFTQMVLDTIASIKQEHQYQLDTVSLKLSQKSEEQKQELLDTLNKNIGHINKKINNDLKQEEINKTYNNTINHFEQKLKDFESKMSHTTTKIYQDMKSFDSQFKDHSKQIETEIKNIKNTGI